MAAQCLISFGSNLGDRDRLIADAARKIMECDAIEFVTPLKTSRLFETPPVGGPSGQEPFLNAVGAFETNSSAREILAVLQSTEQELGRRRRLRWDSRSIDLDVVMHGALVGGASELIVPHPRYTARQFVLQPACDVAPHYRDPRFGWTLQRLAKHLTQGVPSMALVGDIGTRNQIAKSLSADYGIKTFLANTESANMSAVANVPGVVSDLQATAVPGDPIDVVDEPWVAAYLPELPELDSDQTSLPTVPRLVARTQRANEDTRWPAPHQIWPSGWRWPEYRLEIDDLSWAVSEIASALESMRCPAVPVTSDGNWW